MYYVCSNIVKPLTEPFQLSFVELVGSTSIQWFVSHYWGMPVRHFSDAIRKHAQCLDGDWEDSSYWICTFSNSQWHVKEELGLGQWQNSSFYVALRSPECQGTTMIIDESVPAQIRGLRPDVQVHLRFCGAVCDSGSEKSTALFFF